MSTAILPEGRQRYYNNDGTPAAGGKLYTYAAGTSAPKVTYADEAGTTPNPNPVPLDAKGEATIYWDGAYKVNLKQADGQQVTGYPVDNIKTDPGGIWGALATVMANLAQSTGAGLMGFIQIAAGAVKRTVLAKLRDTVSAFDFMTEAQIADVQAAGFTLDVTDALQAAINTGKAVYLPGGLYRTSRPLLLSKASQKIYGDGMNHSVISAGADFASATVGGDTAYAVLWYQAPGLATNDDWIEGGEWSDFGINCNSVKGLREVDGIRINRVAISQSFRNLKISNASVGINGTKWGWCTKFDNLDITGAIHIAIRLNDGYNGCTFTNVFAFGATPSPYNADGSWTEVLVDIKGNCYGNIWSGGAIEGGRVGVRLSNQAQLSLSGVDFEEITERFIEISGNYTVPPYGGGLWAANPTSSAYGCNFVGVPRDGGIYVRGGSISVDGCFAINNEGAPAAGVYFLNGIEGGDATIDGFERLCISESNNTARGWGAQFATGIVASRMLRVVTAGVTFPFPAKPSADVSTLDDYREGTFTPTDASGAGLALANSGGEFTKVGNMVFGNAVVTFPVNANALPVQISGLPYPVGGAAGVWAPNRGGAQISWTDSGLNMGSLLVVGANNFLLFSNTGVGITNAQMSGKSVWLNFAYHI
jgi:hypothetical protein